MSVITLTAKTSDYWKQQLATVEHAERTYQKFASPIVTAIRNYEQNQAKVHAWFEEKAD